jgi:hypothetical protein
MSRVTGEGALPVERVERLDSEVFHLQARVREHREAHTEHERRIAVLEREIHGIRTLVKICTGICGGLVAPLLVAVLTAVLLRR